MVAREKSMSKDTYYFSHDTNAFLDPKIRIVISNYGIMSYAIFWVIVEMLATQKEHKLPLKGFIESIHPLLQGKPLDYIDEEDAWKDTDGNFVSPEIVGCHRIATGIAREIFGMMFDVGLFKTDDKYFWSNSLIDRMKIKDAKSQKQRDIANKRWHSKAKVDNNNANALPKEMPTQYQKKCQRNTLKEKKEKENKVNNILSSDITDIDNTLSANTPESMSLNKNNGYKELIDIYQKESGDFEESSIKRLIKYEELYSKQWVVDAIKDSVLQNEPHIHYIEGILKNYKKEGH
jgi:hypothetical protein